MVTSNSSVRGPPKRALVCMPVSLVHSVPVPPHHIVLVPCALNAQSATCEDREAGPAPTHQWCWPTCPRWDDLRYKAAQMPHPRTSSRVRFRSINRGSSSSSYVALDCPEFHVAVVLRLSDSMIFSQTRGAGRSAAVPSCLHLFSLPLTSIEFLLEVPLRLAWRYRALRGFHKD